MNPQNNITPTQVIFACAVATGLGVAATAISLVVLAVKAMWHQVP